MSLNKLKLLYFPRLQTPTRTVHFEIEKVLSLCYMVDSKRSMPTAPTVHCLQPFCIESYSVELVCPAVVEKKLALIHDFVGEHRKFLCTITLLL